MLRRFKIDFRDGSRRGSPQKLRRLRSLLGGHLSSAVNSTSRVFDYGLRQCAGFFLDISSTGCHTTFIGTVVLKIPGEVFQDEQGGAEEGKKDRRVASCLTTRISMPQTLLAQRTARGKSRSRCRNGRCIARRSRGRIERRNRNWYRCRIRDAGPAVPTRILLLPRIVPAFKAVIASFTVCIL